jgi:putative nucleotidyltransferase with HDIG domain
VSHGQQSVGHPGWPRRNRGLRDALNAAALAGDIPRILAETARLIAAEVRAGTVSIGLIRDVSLVVDSWTIERRDISDCDSRTISLDAGEPLAIVASSGEQVELGGSIVVPVVSLERVLGAIAVTHIHDRNQARGFLNQVTLHTALALEHATLRTSSRHNLQETVSVLAAIIEGRDTYTERHCINLAEMSLAVGLRIGLDSDRLDRLTYGGLLHDIGKIAIPDSILNKTGALTEREFEEMKTHARLGEEILQRIGSLNQVGPIVGQHHERFDGSGYPRGLRGESILFESRILAVVDAFDAMTTTRPYRPALPWPRAIDEISSGAGSQFDPEIADVFLRYLEGEEAQWKTASPT